MDAINGVKTHANTIPFYNFIFLEGDLIQTDQFDYQDQISLNSKGPHSLFSCDSDGEYIPIFENRYFTEDSDSEKASNYNNRRVGSQRLIYSSNALQQYALAQRSKFQSLTNNTQSEKNRVET